MVWGSTVGLPYPAPDGFFFHSQYNFIEHTHAQLTFTKDNLQKNENYNLKLTKKKPNTIKALVVSLFL